MCVERFPIKNEGMASHESQEKRHYIETFRVILSAWPAFPVDLEASLLPSAVHTCLGSRETISTFLHAIILQQFWSAAHCPPSHP